MIQTSRGWQRWFTVGVYFGILVAPAAHAQQRYELAEDQWQKQTTHAPDSPEGRLQTIRSNLAEGHAKTAQQLSGQWIEQYPNHSLLVEAYLLRGDAKVARDNLFDALFDYEHVIINYSASEQFHTALDREFEIARLFTKGLNRRLWGMRLLPADDEAQARELVDRMCRDLLVNPVIESYEVELRAGEQAGV